MYLPKCIVSIVSIFLDLFINFFTSDGPYSNKHTRGLIGLCTVRPCCLFWKMSYFSLIICTNWFLDSYKVWNRPCSCRIMFLFIATTPCLISSSQMFHVWTGSESSIYVNGLHNLLSLPAVGISGVLEKQLMGYFYNQEDWTEWFSSINCMATSQNKLMISHTPSILLSVIWIVLLLSYLLIMLPFCFSP